MSCAQTVIITEDSIRIRASRNPWMKTQPVTEAMEILAGALIRDYTETIDLIEEIEGPTEEELIAWELEYLEIMEGII